MWVPQILCEVFNSNATVEPCQHARPSQQCHVDATLAKPTSKPQKKSNCTGFNSWRVKIYAIAVNQISSVVKGVKVDLFLYTIVY